MDPATDPLGSVEVKKLRIHASGSTYGSAGSVGSVFSNKDSLSESFYGSEGSVEIRPPRIPVESSELRWILPESSVIRWILEESSGFRWIPGACVITHVQMNVSNYGSFPDNNLLHFPGFSR